MAGSSAAMNFNVGILGHVDSGKTTLARALSTKASTAAFDKNPQSQARGITLDLGFSSFVLPAANEGAPAVQVTLVDCPGHASLIRTVIGGAQIVDAALLVVDAVKGVQTQTAECLVLAQIVCPQRLIVVVNKTDLVPPAERAVTLARLDKRLRKTLQGTPFRDAPFAFVAAAPDDGGEPSGLTQLIELLRGAVYVPERRRDGEPLLAVDHCFSIRGQGTVLTGTLLQGRLQPGDELRLPALGQFRKPVKVKSVQVFGAPVPMAAAGDRVGVCVTQLGAKEFERGVACGADLVQPTFAAVVSFARIAYFKPAIATKGRFHVSIGHETVMAKCAFFAAVDGAAEFDLANEYAFVDTVEPADARPLLCLLHFDRAVLCTRDSLYIASRLDSDVNAHVCRLAFHGRLLHRFTDKAFAQTQLPLLKVTKEKRREGVVERLLDEQTVIVHSLFKKETNLDVFRGLRVALSTGETGTIEGAFGLSGKVNVRCASGLRPETVDRLKALAGGKKKGKDKSESDVRPKTDVIPVRVVLSFNRHVYDPARTIRQ